MSETTLVVHVGLALTPSSLLSRVEVDKRVLLGLDRDLGLRSRRQDLLQIAQLLHVDLAVRWEFHVECDDETAFLEWVLVHWHAFVENALDAT